MEIAGEVVTARAVTLVKKVLKSGGSVSGVRYETSFRIRVVVEAYGGYTESSAMSSGMYDANEQ